MLVLFALYPKRPLRIASTECVFLLLIIIIKAAMFYAFNEYDLLLASHTREKLIINIVSTSSQRIAFEGESHRYATVTLEQCKRMMFIDHAHDTLPNSIVNIVEYEASPPLKLHWKKLEIFL